MRCITDLERQVRELATGRGLQAAIKGGSLRVVVVDDDNNNNLRVQVGLLPDGTYGLAAMDDAGTTVKLDTLAFGIRADMCGGGGV